MISYGESDRFCRVAAGKEKIKERAKIAFRSSIIVQYSRNKDIEWAETTPDNVPHTCTDEVYKQIKSIETGDYVVFAQTRVVAKIKTNETDT